MLVVAGCSHAKGIPKPPFTPPLVHIAGAVRETYRTIGAPGAPGVHHYEYVFPDRGIDV